MLVQKDEKESEEKTEYLLVVFSCSSTSASIWEESVILKNLTFGFKTGSLDLGSRCGLAILSSFTLYQALEMVANFCIR